MDVVAETPPLPASPQEDGRGGFSAPIDDQAEETPARRELGRDASWSVSSCKPGFGVTNLRDGRVDTYWQSDGPQPHNITVQFARKTSLTSVYIHVDFKQDESYTPQRIVVRAGASYDHLKDLVECTLNEPQGWQVIPLTDDAERGTPLRCHMLQLVIAANHQNGKDTHVRQVRVFGSRDGGGGGHALGDGTGEHFGGDAVADDIPMATVGMAMYAQLR